MQIYFKRAGLLAIIILLSGFMMACRLSNPQKEMSVQDVSNEDKEKIIVPAISYAWATDGADSVYYFKNMGLWRYEKSSGNSELVTEKLINPQDIVIYKENVYTLEYVDDEENPSRIFLYSNEFDKFEEVASIQTANAAVGMCGYTHYLIVEVPTVNYEIEYKVYDVVNPKKPIEISLDEVELVAEKRELMADDDKRSILYKGKEIANVDDFGGDLIEVWGRNDKYGFICVNTEFVDEFFYFELAEPYDMKKIGENIKWIAVFDEAVLVKSESGEVEIKNFGN